MRYMLNVNPAGATALLETVDSTSEPLRIQFSTPAKLAHGAVAKVRLVQTNSPIDDSGVFSPRDNIGNRYRTTLNAQDARRFGLRGKTRYELRRSGRSDWFWLVPHSNVGKGRRIDGPGITASIYDK